MANKNYEELSFGELLMLLRKKHKQYSSRVKLSSAIGINKWSIESLENNRRRPSRSELNSICQIFDNPTLREKGLYLIMHPDVKLCFSDKTTCWRCRETMCTAYGLIDNSPISPDCFNEAMCEIAKQKGVILQDRQSGTTGETHLVNVCPHCGTFIGNFYLHDLWYGETETIQIEDVADFIEEEI